MSRPLLWWWCLAGVLLSGGAATADEPVYAPVEEAPAREDSREIETFSILGERDAPFVGTESWSGLTSERIERSDARSAADVLRRAPGALVQTNSRGETLVYLRNAGERQVTIFLDGAPLNVPWDYRVDLALVPGLAIDRVEVARGPLSNRYGPNVSGGALFLETPSPFGATRQRAAIEAGEAGYYRLQAQAAISGDVSGGTLAAERTALDGQPVADAATLPFSQTGALRTNTDQARTSALGRVGTRLGDLEFSLTTLYGRSRSGVAPESHVDPVLDQTRYWRYPDTSLGMIIGSANGPLTPTLELDATSWVQLFDQTIESYTDAAYDTLDERQRDRDRSAGLSLRLEQALHRHRFAASFLGSTSEHRQTNGKTPEERFSSTVWSAGLDHSYETDAIMTRLGVGFDGLAPRDTAGRDSTGAITAWNVSGGARWTPTADWFLRAAAGSRARLPTLRELFGVALDRFVLNPDLRAERNTTVEVATGLERHRSAVELIGFAQWTSDTIAQEVVEVEGQSRRRRVNLGNSQVVGAEFVARATVLDWMVVGGHVVASDVRARDADGETTRLAERPELQGFGEIVLGLPGAGPELTVEGFARTEAYSLTSDGFVRLPDSLITNLRLAYRLTLFDRVELTAHARVDNVFDDAVVPQVGLPDPGRWLRAGLSLTM